MLYISVDDFYKKVSSCEALSRQEEIECAKLMKKGDAAARARIIQNYLPMAAGHIKHVNPNKQTLGLVLCCVREVEKAVDSFDFLQDSEPFSHRLSWQLRQAVVNYTLK